MVNSYSFLEEQSNIPDWLMTKYLSYLQDQERLKSLSKLSTRPLKTLGDSKGHPVANRPYERHTLKDILNAIKVYEGYKKTGEITEWGTRELKRMKEEMDIRMKEYSDKQKLSKLKQILTTNTIPNWTTTNTTNWQDLYTDPTNE